MGSSVSAVKRMSPSFQRSHVVLRLGVPFLTAELRGSLSAEGRINNIRAPQPHNGFVTGNMT